MAGRSRPWAITTRTTKARLRRSRSGGLARLRQPGDERGAGEAPLVADPAAGQAPLLGEGEHGVLVELQERGGLARREHVGQTGRAERLVADDERGLVGLDDHAARARGERVQARTATE